MSDFESTDISTIPGLGELVEIVRRSGESMILRVGDEDVAVLSPISQRLQRNARKSSIDEQADISEARIRESQREALIATAGILADADIPEWATPESTSEWLDRIRHRDRT